MSIETDAKAYRNFKKAVKLEKCISMFGDAYMSYTVNYLILGSIMREAHWLVTEEKCVNKFYIEGLFDNDEIYVKYSDEQIDFRKRR